MKDLSVVQRFSYLVEIMAWRQYTLKGHIQKSSG